MEADVGGVNASPQTEHLPFPKRAPSPHSAPSPYGRYMDPKRLKELETEFDATLWREAVIERSHVQADTGQVDSRRKWSYFYAQTAFRSGTHYIFLETATDTFDVAPLGQSRDLNPSFSSLLFSSRSPSSCGRPAGPARPRDALLHPADGRRPLRPRRGAGVRPTPRDRPLPPPHTPHPPQRQAYASELIN